MYDSLGIKFKVGDTIHITFFYETGNKTREGLIMQLLPHEDHIRFRWKDDLRNNYCFPRTPRYVVTICNDEST